jgi:hypothetical protein
VFVVKEQRNVPGEQVGNRRTGSFVGNVIHFRAGKHLKPFDTEVIGCADTGRAVRQLSRVVLRVIDHLGQSIHWRLIVDRDHIAHAADIEHRREILFHVVSGVLVQAAID